MQVEVGDYDVGVDTPEDGEVCRGDHNNFGVVGPAGGERGERAVNAEEALVLISVFGGLGGKELVPRGGRDGGGG